MIKDFIACADKDRRFPWLICELIECEDIMHTVTPAFSGKAEGKLSPEDRKAVKQWYIKIREKLRHYIDYEDMKYIAAQVMFYINRHTRLTVDGERCNPDRQELALHQASEYILSLLFQ